MKTIEGIKDIAKVFSILIKSKTMSVKQIE